MRVLVTGGSGFIGSHTVVSLIEAGHEPVVIDNLSNSRPSVISRIGEIAGAEPEFHQIDIRDRAAVASVASRGIEACIHFAALKSVGESVRRPLEYYDNNVIGTIALVEELLDAGVETFIFSSSATVYGDPSTLPLTEDQPSGGATNPYGWTKIMMEQILRDLQAAHSQWSVSLLRYFNPVGAHPSGLLGEDPADTPTNLMPLVARVAAGLATRVQVFGGDYPTPDGTPIRDYVHVVDVAEGHVAALDAHAADPGVHVYNLGTGKGHSVLEVIKAYEESSGKPIPYEIVGRRPGDVAATWADVSRAEARLGWRATRDLHRMCADSWRWQQKAR
ncbi:MAG TPA: UDP-glucose 4-epimerase GalE [Acidimicrobiia bacterium]|nr:UDP-glucose 4-epimerase GalE [Acidimicrobiia bacterium]